MALLTKKFLYFITDSAGRCKYVDNGVIKTSSPPVPLPQNPKGWKDIQISFGTNKKYFSLNRSFTLPLFFVGDGATICREAVWAGKGYQEELYIVILKLNPDNGIHELEYKGRLDFGHQADEPRKGITVATIEGGPMQYLANNDSVPYEIPLDITNTDCIQGLFKGVTLFDRYRYSVINVDIPQLPLYDWNVTAYTIPFAFISNEGDSVGILQGTQSYEVIAHSGSWTNSMLNPYCTSSANYAFSSTAPITLKKVSGNISFDVHQAGGNLGVWILIQTSLGNRYNILGTPSSYHQYSSSQSVNIPVSLVIPLAANEKIFAIAVVASVSVSSQSITWQNTDVFFEFNSITPASKAYFIQSIYLWRQLVLKMTGGRYTGDSLYLQANKNIGWTSTNALRNFSYNYFFGTFDCIDTAGIYTIKIPGTLANFPDGAELIISGAFTNNGGYTVLGTSLSTIGYTVITVEQPLINATITGQISTAAVIKISPEDFFNDLDCDQPMGIKCVNNVLWLEPIGDLYKSDAQIFDIGEITDLKFNYAYDWLCNTGTFGSRSQDYRQRNGRYEFNTTTKFQFPVDTLKKDYTKITKSRRDCFGIEFIRALIFDKPTTDTTGDNQPFMVDLIKGVDYDFYQGAFKTQNISGTYFISIFPPINTAVLSPGDVITISGAASNNGIYTIVSIGYSTASTDIIVIEPVTTASLTGTLSVHNANLYQPNRPAYSSITGVLDNTVFNTTMTPHRQLLGHGRMLDSIMFQLQAEKIIFRTTDKNGDLVTTLGPITIAEKQDEIVGNIGAPYFYPFYGVFKTKVPITFAKILSNIGTGYIKGTYIGIPLYFLPIGKMDAKPAFNEAQEWEMILAGPEKNSLATIKLLSLEGEFTTDAMGNFIFTSYLNALHWVKYNFTQPPKYKYKTMDDDHHANRNLNYIGRPDYKQKWQKTENIPMQCITKGMGQVVITVYDANGNVYFTDNMAVTSDPAVIAPKTRWDYQLVISGYPDGFYIAVMSSGGVNLRITEWLDIKEEHRDTLLLDYSDTVNKFGYYWTGVPAPNVRVEAKLLAEYPDSVFTDYTDELADVELLDGIPMQKQLLTLGGGRGTKIFGVPDWMGRKISMICLLNRCFADGHHIVRTTDGKFDKKQIVGTPFYQYNIEVAHAHGQFGLSTDETGANEDAVVAATLDAQGFGIAPPGSVIDIEMPLVP